MIDELYFPLLDAIRRQYGVALDELIDTMERMEGLLRSLGAEQSPDLDASIGEWCGRRGLDADTLWRMALIQVRLANDVGTADDGPHVRTSRVD